MTGDDRSRDGSGSDEGPAELASVRNAEAAIRDRLAPRDDDLGGAARALLAFANGETPAPEDAAVLGIPPGELSAATDANETGGGGT
jgi:hypothetical protein